MNSDDKLAELKKSLGIAAAITELADSLLDGIYMDTDELQEKIEEFQGMEDTHVLVELLRLAREFSVRVQAIDTFWTPVYGRRNFDLHRFKEEVKQARIKGYPEGLYINRAHVGEVWATVYRHNGDGIWLANQETMTDLNQLPGDLIPLIAVDNQPESE